MMHCIFGSGRPNKRELIFCVFIYTESDLCLMFYLHMYGEGTGEIRVYQRFTDGSTREVLTRRGAADTGNRWRGIKRTLHNSNSLSYTVCVMIS